MLTIPEMWYVLNNHYVFAWSNKPVEIIIDPVFVNPIDNIVSTDRTKNTKLRYWAEVIIPEKIVDDRYQYHYGYSVTVAMCHDSDLDCGADTYELLIEKLYSLFVEKYGLHDESLLRSIKIYNPGRSGIITYLKESRYNLENIKLDLEYLNDHSNFKEAIKETIQFVDRYQRPGMLHCIYLDSSLTSSYDSESVVNIGSNTYKVPFKEATNGYDSKIVNESIEIICRLFKVESLEFLWCDESKDFLLFEDTK